MKQKPCLTTADVQRIAAACRAEAVRNGWSVTIAIVDDGGHLLFLERDGARVSTVQVAIGKARTSALMQYPSGQLQDRIRESPQLLALDAMPLQGGMPLLWAGECVGGIGVSGVRPEEDEQIARAGCTALAASQGG
jgi:glc operon protein GlcG